MNKKLFSNKITISSTREKVMEVLKNPEKPLALIPDIISVENISTNQYKIIRNEPSVNTSEVITLKENNDEIIFKSTGGRFSYDLVFNIEDSVDDKIILTETLTATKETKLPLSLLAPIAKHAFSQTLSGLKSYIEVLN